MTNPLYEYSLWLHNRYVEAIQGHDERLRSREYANLMQDALRKHLELNLQGKKVGFARQWTKALLKDISLFIKDPKKHPVSYLGSEAKKLTEKDERLYKRKQQAWERGKNQYISDVGDFTEVKALVLIATMVQAIEQFRTVKMTSYDDAQVCGVGNILLRIMRANGYEMSSDPHSKTPIAKIDNY